MRSRCGFFTAASFYLRRKRRRLWILAAAAKSLPKDADKKWIQPLKKKNKSRMKFFYKNKKNFGEKKSTSVVEAQPGGFWLLLSFNFFLRVSFEVELGGVRAKSLKEYSAQSFRLD